MSGVESSLKPCEIALLRKEDILEYPYIYRSVWVIGPIKVHNFRLTSFEMR
jgi:hypothetical protein